MAIVSYVIKIINGIWKFISFLYKFREIYKITGLVATRKFPEAKTKHKYAVLVAARNEEAVIGNLIESIKNQDYPNELIKIFVVADNCSDNTFKESVAGGAVCYERKDNKHRTKGYALQYLVERIREDYGIESFDGYFIFDADNLLARDYITRMNEAFDAGERIITSYRNTKNFNSNWISASYALHWLRTIRNEHRARSLFHLATRIQGTGFLFANELIKDGWKYTSLTEDRAFCADAVAQGYKISYNNEAIFYDEQPIDIKTAMRQRIRWSKGHIQAFLETGPKLFCNIFYIATDIKSKIYCDCKSQCSIIGLLKSIRLRFMCFDMLTVVIPKALISVLRKIMIYILRVILIVNVGEVFVLNYAPDFLKKLFNIFDIELQLNNKSTLIIWLTIFAFGWSLSSYFNGVITACYIFIVERKRIMYIKWYKKLWYMLTFPIFDIIGKISLLIAMFAKVEWEVIPHTNSISINDLECKIEIRK